MKAFSSPFSQDKLGGGQDEDWDRHKEAFEYIFLYYQLKSKDLAYCLRLTLMGQALAFHQSEYLKNFKTYSKICDVLKSRFDTRTKRKTNSR